MRAEAGAVAAVAGALLVGAVPHQHYARRGAVSAARPVRNLRTGVACRAQFGRMGRTVKLALHSNTSGCNAACTRNPDR